MTFLESINYWNNAILDDSSDETCNTISQIQKEIWESMVRATKP